MTLATNARNTDDVQDPSDCKICRVTGTCFLSSLSLYSFVCYKKAKPKSLDRAVSVIFGISTLSLDQKSLLKNPTDQQIQKSKLLYYHPESRSLDDQLSHFGLIEGLIALSNTFTTEDIDFIRSKLYVTVIIRWVKNVYLALSFANENTSDEKSEYSCYWKNRIFKVIVKNSIKIFELLYGDLYTHLHPLEESRSNSTAIAENHDAYTLNTESDDYIRLKFLFSEFFPTFMTKSIENGIIILKDLDCHRRYHGNISITLDAQMIMDELCSEFKVILNTLLIYNNQLLHTSLDNKNMLGIYLFLIRHRGEVTKNKSNCIKWSGSNDLVIVESHEDSLFSPTIYINDVPCTMSILTIGDCVLVLLLDEVEDILLTMNSIREYVENMPCGLIQLNKTLVSIKNTSSNNAGNNKLENIKTFTINKLTRTINNIGFDDVDNAKLEELSLIYDIHSLIELSRDDVMKIHMRIKRGWINTKVSNNREVYYINNHATLSDTKNQFDTFISTYLNGVYFI